MSVTIITVTYNRSKEVLKRCLDCVESQTFKDWHHLVIVDDETIDQHISSHLLKMYSCQKREFLALGYHSNNWGNSPRQFAIEYTKDHSKFIVFLDDDNVVFPNYLDTFMTYFQKHPSHDLVICRIIHLGPLPSFHCPPPKILDGNPPVLQNIDTLQVCLRSHIAKTFGWLDKGYMADGYTIQNFAEHCTYGFLEDILGVHM